MRVIRGKKNTSLKEMAFQPRRQKQGAPWDSGEKGFFRWNEKCDNPTLKRWPVALGVNKRKVWTRPVLSDEYFRGERELCGSSPQPSTWSSPIRFSPGSNVLVKNCSLCPVRPTGTSDIIWNYSDFVCFCFFEYKITLWSQDWPGTHSVVQAGLGTCDNSPPHAPECWEMCELADWVFSASSPS